MRGDMRSSRRRGDAVVPRSSASPWPDRARAAGRVAVEVLIVLGGAAAIMLGTLAIR